MGDLFRAEVQDELLKAWYENRLRFAHHMTTEVVERLVADGVLPEGTRWVLTDDAGIVDMGDESDRPTPDPS